MEASNGVVNNNNNNNNNQHNTSTSTSSSALSATKSFDFLFKIVLIGDSGVGKTSLLNRYRNGTFDPATKHTIGVEFATKELVIKNKNVKAQIWDTAGQERYRAITKAYYRGAVGALIVYDITDRETFDSLKRWLSEVQANSDPSIKLMLVGNKCDLVEKRKVHIDEGKAFAEQHGLSFVEASAFNGDAVEDAFDHLMGKIFDQQIARIKTFQAEQLSIPSSSSSGSSNKDGSKISKGESIQLEKIDAELRGKKLGISQSSGCCT